jgi:peroxiredoxin
MRILKPILTSLAMLLMVSAAAHGAATTESRNGLLPLGSPAPAFSLKDVVSGRLVSLDDFKDKEVLVVISMCRHCPFVQRVKGGLAQLGNDYMGESVGIVAFSSNDSRAYAEDSPEKLAEMSIEEGFVFPVLFDGDKQEMGRAYTAVATPDVFVFDGNRKLVYRGQFDDARPGNATPVTGKDVRDAINAVLESGKVSANQKPAIGCSIKWKKGNEPSYL